MRVLRVVRRAMTGVGVPDAALCAALERHDVDLEATDGFAPWIAYRALWVAAESHCSDEALGLRVAAAVPFGARDAIDYAMRTADTGSDVAALAMRLAPVVNGGTESAVERHPQGICVSSRFLAGLTGTPGMSDFTLARMLAIIRVVFDDDVVPVAVQTIRNKPASTRRHDDLFRCEITFSASFNGLVLPESVLDRRPPHADEHLHRVLLSHPQLAPKTHRAIPLSERVARVVTELLDSGHAPSQTTIARRVGLSARTLRRLLEAENASFASVLDDVRSARARSELIAGRRLAEVAESLGYESTSTFVRAFRRWTGETPAAWRARRASERDAAAK